MLGSVVLDPDSAIPGSYLSAHGVPTGYAGEEIIGTMTFAPSIWALEIDGNLPKIRQPRPRSRTSPKVV
jgi:hypothetical protein